MVSRYGKANCFQVSSQVPLVLISSIKYGKNKNQLLIKTRDIRIIRITFTESPAQIYEYVMSVIKQKINFKLRIFAFAHAEEQNYTTLPSMNSLALLSEEFSRFGITQSVSVRIPYTRDPLIVTGEWVAPQFGQR